MAKKSDKEKGVLKHSLLSQEEAKKLQKYPYAAKINIDDKEVFIAERKRYIEEVEELRSAWDLPNRWQECRDQYDGVVETKDFPWEDCSNLHIHITSMTVDVMKTKAKAQMFVSPMMLVKPLPGQVGEGLYPKLALKEKFMDYKAQEELDIEEKLDPILQDAINIGTGIGKLFYSRRIERDALVSRVYDPTEDDIENFKLDYADDEGTAAYKRYLKDLERGISVEVWAVSDEVLEDNPKISYVKLEDLYLRPDIVDIDNQREISERLTYTWRELVDHVKQGYFNLGESVLEDLKAKYEKDFHKRIYEAYETICYYDYEKTDTPKKIVVTWLKEEGDYLLRAITFPYLHRKAYYVPYYIKKRADSFYGDGIAERLKYTNKAMDTMWNQIADSGALRNAPTFVAVKDSGFDPSEKKYGPAKIWWVAQKGNVEALNAGGMPSEMVNLIMRLERYAEWQTGVTAYASGRESPVDPNAPASKAYMLLKESNLRINDSIKQLHKGNKNVFEQLEKLVYQHMRGNKLSFNVMVGENIETQPITKKTIGLKVRYVPQMADITENKEFQKEQDLKFGQYLMQIPLVQSVPTALRTILEIQVRNQGGQWERSLDKILGKENEGITPSPVAAPAVQIPGVSVPQGAPAAPGIPAAPLNIKR